MKDYEKELTLSIKQMQRIIGVPKKMLEQSKTPSYIQEKIRLKYSNE